MKCIFFLILFLLSLIFSSQLSATEIRVMLLNNKISVGFDNISYPVKLFSQELKNGLPNVLDILVKIENQDRVLQQEIQSYVITYDLWDENYTLLRISAEEQKKLVLKNEKALMLYLSKMSTPDILDIDGYMRRESLTLSFQMFFNPIKEQRIEKIKSWIKTSYVNSNQVNVAKGVNNISINNLDVGQRVGTSSVAIISNGPRFQKLFDKILEEYAKEDSVAAEWKSKPVTEIFTIESLLRENK